MQLMSIEDLAIYLGVAKRTIYKYLADGDCPPYIKLSSKNISFDRADVDAWLESKKVYPERGGEKVDSTNADSNRTPASRLDPDRWPWTARAKASLEAARRQARDDGFAQVGTEHLLLGILSVPECLGAVILARLGVSDQCRQRYAQTPHAPEKPVRGKVPLSEDVEKAVECAREQASQWGHTYLGAEHLLAGILMAQRGAGFQILSDLGVTLARVQEETAKLVVCRQTAGE